LAHLEKNNSCAQKVVVAALQTTTMPSAVGKKGAGGPLRSRGNFQVFDLAAGRVINESRYSE
jgi:hypothetical protein